MPKLPVVRTRHVIAAVTRAGAVRVSQAGSHIKFRRPDGHLFIVVDYGARDYPLGTLRKTIEQAGLTVAKFRELLKE